MGSWLHIWVLSPGSVCLGSGVSYGVASCPGLAFIGGVGAALALGSDGTWCPGFSVSLWCRVSGIQG